MGLFGSKVIRVAPTSASNIAGLPANKRQGSKRLRSGCTQAALVFWSPCLYEPRSARQAVSSWHGTLRIPRSQKDWGSLAFNDKKRNKKGTKKRTTPSERSWLYQGNVSSEPAVQSPSLSSATSDSQHSAPEAALGPRQTFHRSPGTQRRRHPSASRGGSLDLKHYESHLLRPFLSPSASVFFVIALSIVVCCWKAVEVRLDSLSLLPRATLPGSRRNRPFWVPSRRALFLSCSAPLAARKVAILFRCSFLRWPFSH